MPTKKKQSSEAAVREIRRRARRRFSAEEKIRIVLEGLRGEESIAALCRREGIAAIPPSSVSFGSVVSKSVKSEPSREAAYSSPFSRSETLGATQIPIQSFVPSSGMASTTRISGSPPS